MISVLVVDDQAMVRAGLKSLLELPGEGPPLLVDLTAENGRQAVELVRTHSPDVVLMDIRMPIMDGIDALRAIRADERTHGLPVLMLTTFDEDDLIFGSLEAGASGFLRKDLEPGPLQAAVLSAYRGDPVLDPRVTGRVIARSVRGQSRDEAAKARLNGLTGRELELLGCVGRGLTNEEIAGELFLSAATTRTYVSRLLAKLDCRDRVALAILAHLAGVVER